MGEIKTKKVHKLLLKHEIEANWLLSNYVPDKGEIVIFDREINQDGVVAALPENRTIPYDYQRFKLGDGIQNVNDLPFAAANAVDIDPEIIKELEDKLTAEITKQTQDLEKELINTLDTQIDGCIKKVESTQESVLFWQTYPDGYSHFGETYDDISDIPSTSEAKEIDSIVYIFQNLAEEKQTGNNSLTLDTDGDNRYLNLTRNAPGNGSRFQFKCQRKKEGDAFVNEELCFSTKITIEPSNDDTSLANRGIAVTGTSGIGAEGKLYGIGFNITRNAGESTYVLSIQSNDKNTIQFELQDLSFTLTIIYEGLTQGDPFTCFVKTENDIITKTGYLPRTITGIVGYDMFSGGTQPQQGNQGYAGSIYFDNTYFGPRNEVAEAGGEYKMIPATERVEGESVVMRDKDGAVLVKKELNDSDNIQSATSKYYVDNLVKKATEKPIISYIDSIDTIYNTKEELPTEANDGLTILVNEDRAIYKYNASLLQWEIAEVLREQVIYCVLNGKKSGLYKYTNGELPLAPAEKKDLENAKEYTDQEISKVEKTIADVQNKVDGLEVASSTAIIHSQKPTSNISAYNFYSYTDLEEEVYAISTARKNHMLYNGYEVPINVEVEKGFSNPSEIKSPKSVFSYELDWGDLTNPIITGTNIYYLTQSNEAYVYVDDLIAAKLKISSGWHSPSSALGDDYGGVIDSPLSAEWGKTYVVAEIKEKIHTVQYYNGAWQEISINPETGFVRRLGDISYEAFKKANSAIDDSNEVVVYAYRALNNNYDRVYVEEKGNRGVIADYCLTPSVDEIPDNPWQDPDEPVSKLKSIPVRLEDGGIQVYTDEKSVGSYAVSKDYLNIFSERIVKKKPEESADVYNAGLLSAHTWTPDDNGYDHNAEKFDNGIIPKQVITVATTGAPSDADPETYGNKIYVSEGSLVCEKEVADKQVTLQVARQDLNFPAIFLFKILLEPTGDQINNRGLTFTPYNNQNGGNPIWSTKTNFNIVPSADGSGNYSFQINKDNEDTASEIALIGAGEWHSIRLELDGKDPGSARRIFLDNELKYSGIVPIDIGGIKAYRIQILAKNNAGESYKGKISFDDVYFGETPLEARYNGYDTLTPVVYDYEEKSIKELNKESIPLRKPDGAILTKKEILEEDDDRTAVSKHYVHENFVYINDNTYYTINGGCIGTDIEIFGDEDNGYILLIEENNSSELIITDTADGMIADII